MSCASHPKWPNMSIVPNKSTIDSQTTIKKAQSNPSVRPSYFWINLSQSLTHGTRKLAGACLLKQEKWHLTFTLNHILTSCHTVSQQKLKAFTNRLPVMAEALENPQWSQQKLKTLKQWSYQNRPFQVAKALKGLEHGSSSPNPTKSRFLHSGTTRALNFMSSQGHLYTGHGISNWRSTNMGSSSSKLN